MSQTHPRASPRNAEASPGVANKSSVFNMQRTSRTPNVFTTAPRPGGFLRTVVSPNGKEMAHINEVLGVNCSIPKPSQRAKLFEGFANMSEMMSPGNATGQNTHKSGVDHSSQEEIRWKSRSQRSRSRSPASSGDENSIESEWTSGIWNLSQDHNNVLAVAISTIMSLAANPETKPTDNHLLWTASFLSNIKNEENNTPRNIMGIKKLMMPLVEPIANNTSIMDDFKEDDTKLPWKADRGRNIGGPSKSRDNSKKQKKADSDVQPRIRIQGNPQEPQTSQNPQVASTALPTTSEPKAEPIAGNRTSNRGALKRTK